LEIVIWKFETCILAKAMQIPSSTIYEQFEKVCRDFSDKPALVYLGRQYRYSELHEA